MVVSGRQTRTLVPHILALCIVHVLWVVCIITDFGCRVTTLHLVAPGIQMYWCTRTFHLITEYYGDLLCAAWQPMG